MKLKCDRCPHGRIKEYCDYAGPECFEETKT
jgi:hypothetical protein